MKPWWMRDVLTDEQKEQKDEYNQQNSGWGLQKRTSVLETSNRPGAETYDIGG